MGKKGPLWWRESDWLLRGSSAANQILLRHSGPILSSVCLSLSLSYIIIIIIIIIIICSFFSVMLQCINVSIPHTITFCLFVFCKKNGSLRTAYPSTMVVNTLNSFNIMLLLTALLSFILQQKYIPTKLCT